MARHYGFPIFEETFEVGRKVIFFFLRRKLFLRRVSFRYDSKNNDKKLKEND